MRTVRIIKSTAEIDRIENEWWNVNSATIETIWAHTYRLQRSIRYPYLKKAKAFLQDSGGKKLVWEVGCGTGWVCRMIADSEFNILGTDFSKAQIDTAIKQAAKFNKHEYCSYEVSDASSVVEGHDGIFIHALLHHLSQEELEGFFKLMATQRKGIRVFLYEPVFPAEKFDKISVSAYIVKKVIGLFRKSANLLIRILGKRNDTLIDQANFISKEAETKGWFLSPKEVPFYESELDNYLRQDFTIHKKYFVNMLDYTLAMNLVLHNLGEPGFIFTKIILPMATWLDRLFFSLDFRSVTKGQYFFCCYELEKK
jgi:SAM-dependent methyltransferase